MPATVIHDVPLLLAGLRSGMNAAEVGRWLGVSRERIRQIWVRETGEAHVPVWRVSRDQDSVRIRKFWASVSVIESGCWEWKALRYPTGYGRPPFRATGKDPGYAHRVSYGWMVGPIPAGLTIDHLCRNPPCVNPSHLEAVTSRENTMRSPIAVAAINARKTHCKHGHEFTDANTARVPALNGRIHRHCRACASDRSRRDYANRKAAAA